HFYLISGDCMPIQSARAIRAELAPGDRDWIETVDFHEGGWIRTGLTDERLAYRHYFNERNQKALFYASMGLQRRLGLTRQTPADMVIRIGSQWWCLRRGTVERILDFCRARRDVVRFFRTTWIPDETFFQTLVPHLVPEAEIENRPPTFLMFSDYGMPVTFYDDHHDLLTGQDAFFARKVSAEAEELRERLGALYGQEHAERPPAVNGRRLHALLTRQGRQGQRFGPRAWEDAAALGPDRQLHLIVCKKWHVAKRLLARVRQVADVTAVEYVFNEESTPLPPLGGLERGMAKRGRHRRAFVGMLFEQLRVDRLVLCLDPGDMDIVQDLAGSPAEVRVLDIACRFSEDYLAGHAERIGLVPAAAPASIMADLIPVLQQGVHQEARALRMAGLPGYARLEEGGDNARNAMALAGFLDIPRDLAAEIAEDDHLFAD
ncbi:MAG: DUF5928 domain-containing protein, partial [Pseudomonadota bacterium]